MNALALRDVGLKITVRGSLPALELHLRADVKAHHRTRTKSISLGYEHRHCFCRMRVSRSLLHGIRRIEE